MLHTIRRDTDRPERVLFVLPGYGDFPKYFLERVDEFDPERRWLVIVPEPRLQSAAGPIWYSVDENGIDQSAFSGSLDALSDCVSQTLEETGIGSDRLVIAGFSQGGALALASLLVPSFQPMPNAVAVLAGYLADHDDINLATAIDRPVLIAHGRDDETVDTIRGRSAAKALDRSGAIVSWSEVDGGHRFGPDLLAPFRLWLDELVRAELPHRPIA
ncbi:COG0400 Predicted esterase [Acidimicrobiia bacterium]